MPFANYIVLDGKRYKTLSKQWKPTIVRPAAVRQTLQGVIEGTFGAASHRRWEGLIVVPVTAQGAEYGTRVDLEATLEKHTALTFSDHYGTAYDDAVVQGPFTLESLINVWDAPPNKFYVNVIITAKHTV